MTIQLSQEQIQALRVELRQYGLNVLPLPKSRGGAPKAKETAPVKPRNASRIAEVRAWKPETAAGRACKSNMLKWLQAPKPVGVTSHESGACYPYRNHNAAKIAAWYAMPHETRVPIVAAIREVRKQFSKAETSYASCYPADRDNPEHRARIAAKIREFRKWRRALRVAMTDPKDMAA